MIAIAAHPGGLFGRGHDAKGPHLFRRRSPLKRIQPVPSSPYSIRRVLQWQLGGFGSYRFDPRAGIFDFHADWSA